VDLAPEAPVWRREPSPRPGVPRARPRSACASLLAPEQPAGLPRLPPGRRAAGPRADSAPAAQALSRRLRENSPGQALEVELALGVLRGIGEPGDTVAYPVREPR